MPFTDQQKVDVRRYCGYPAYATFGWVFEEDYSTLEMRMNGMSDNEVAVVTGNYLSSLSTLETAIAGASSNLDTAEAAVWTHNPKEVADRVDLYNYTRRQLCAFIGVKPGRGLNAATTLVRT